MAVWATELPDEFFAAKLVELENGIHAAQNRVKHARVMGLISIGLRSAKLEALAEAKRIEKVDVDHGETSCVTLEPIAYMAKAKARKARKKA